MKATIEFDEEVQFDQLIQYLQGPRACNVLWDVDQHLRSTIKHGDLTEDSAAALQSVREYLRTSLAEQGISIDA